MNKQKIKKYLSEFKILIILVIVAFTVKSSILEIYMVPTGSMEDEILVGDLLVGNKFSYGMRTPNWIGIPYTRIGFYIPSIRLPGFKQIENGDVAMFEYPRDPYIKYVKRCIGTPKDKIKIEEGVVYINGKVMPFPDKAKFVTIDDADIDGDGHYCTPDDNVLAVKNNNLRFKAACHKLSNDTANYQISNKFKNKNILLNSNFEVNPFRNSEKYLNRHSSLIKVDSKGIGINKESNILEQYIHNSIYPYFSGNNDNIEEFIVPYKGMNINIDEWIGHHNEWISLITLFVQDGNAVSLGGINFVMDDASSIARMKGLIWYKIFDPGPKGINQRRDIFSKEKELKSKNKKNRNDNPWNIYDNPYLYSVKMDGINNAFEHFKMNSSSKLEFEIFTELEKLELSVIDLNQDNKIDVNDLVNDIIFKSFKKEYDEKEIDSIIQNQYKGNRVLFSFDFYKQYADKFIRENLKINGEFIADSYKVKKNYYFFMGDNRDNSSDSRVWGFVPDNLILGTPLFSLVNLNSKRPRFKTIN